MANRLSYVNYDYDELVQQLIDRLKAKGTWKDTYQSATGMTLIELYAYLANMLLYYIERRTEECFLGTAQNKSSIINLVRLLNYVPKRNVSAVGSVQFSISAAVEGRIYIPQYTEIYTANNIKFVTTAQGTIEAGSTTSNIITAIQGTKQQYVIYSDGSSNQEVNIEDTKVENDTHTGISSLRVYVDGREWTKVDSFLSSVPSDEYYMIRPELDDTITIVFGDNIRGKAPASGNAISIDYIRSDGSSGNVYETGKIINVTSPSVTYSYVDDDGVTQNGTATLLVTNITTMIGGDDAEGAEEIRTEAPNIFKTGDRLVTRTDFEAFLYNYPSIAEAYVWGENEETNPDYNMFNRVNIVLLLEGWQSPPAALKTLLEEAMYEKSMLTVKYEFIDADIFNVVPVLDVVVNSKYSLSTTQAEIEALLASLFELGKTAKFAENKRLSNLIEKVDGLESVKYIHMTLEVREPLTEDYSSGYWGVLVQSSSIKPETCRIFVGTTEIATDTDRNDGSNIGDFNSIESGYAVNGTVDYTTGEVLVDISPAPTSVVLRYQQDEDGDVVVGNNGICKLYSVDIQSIGY